MKRSPLDINAKSILRKKISVKDLVKAWSETYDIEVAHLFSGSKEIVEFQCQESGLIFYGPPNLSGDGEFYVQLSKIDSYYSKDKWEFDEALKDIGTNSPRVLEIGSGFGHFLSKLNHQDKAIGLELNEDGVDECRKKGLDVRRVDLDEFAYNNKEAFDVVCSFQVLEHVEDVKGFLVNQLKMLKIGGKLIVSVPNEESFLSKDPFPILNMPPHHLTRWSPKTGQFLETFLPVKLKELRFEPLDKNYVNYYVNCQLNWFPSIPKVKGLLVRMMRTFVSIPFIRKKMRGQALYMIFEKT